MKIALVTHLLSPQGGGVTQVVDDLFFNLSESINCMRFGLPDRGLYFSIGDGFKVGRYGFDTNLTKRIMSWKPDLIHLHGLFTFASFSAWSASKHLGIPLVVSPHGMLDTWAINNSRFKKRLFFATLEKKVLASSSCIHALNSEELQSIRDLWPDNVDLNYEIIPNGVMPKKRSVVRANADQLILLYLGRIHPKKGIAELIVALSFCKRTFPDLKHKLLVNIVGWGDHNYLRFLRDMVASLGLEEVVAFRGPAFNDDKAGYFSSADAFILPSHSEGLPMAVLEAWSYGLPVLMTRECNLATGFQADAAIPIELDPARLSASLVSLLKLDRSILEDMGRNGLLLTERQFTWDVIGKKYREMYLKVLDSYAFK